MIETLASLKIILILLLAILILNDLFLSQQTVETANFFAARADLVHQDTIKVDRFFNRTILKSMVFTKTNHFFKISNIQTTFSEKENKIKTTLTLNPQFTFSTSAKSNPHQFSLSSFSKKIKTP